MKDLCRFFETRIVTIVEEPFEFESFGDWNWTGEEVRPDEMYSKKTKEEFSYPDGILLHI